MTYQWATAIGLGSAFLALSLPSSAHHGQAGLFDQTRMVHMTGSVKEWSFVNPHPVLVIEITAADGTTAAWDVYFGPSAMTALRKRGFTAATFKVGDTVVVNGHPATAASARGIDVWGADSSVTRADGTPIP
jgi:Family of unknown function (DUF6152)